jgi:hypothetical protein
MIFPERLRPEHDALARTPALWKIRRSGLLPFAAVFWEGVLLPNGRHILI